MLRYIACVATLLALSAFASPLGPDGQSGVRLPGKFVWLDLATEDPASARAFYGTVFGWKFTPARSPAAPYALIENATGKVAGIFRHERPAGASVGARWIALMSVPDARTTADLVRARGGKVLVEPDTFAGRGTHAVFRDPDGAVFGVLVTEGGDPPDTPVEQGDVFWLDLFSPDPSKAAAFYAAIGGYEVARGEIAGRSRTLLASQGIARAGIAHLPAGAQKPAWLPYVLVDDVRGTLERAQQAGGRIVMAPRDDVLDGNVAVIADREGGVIGIVKWPSDASAADGSR
jgi:hypothetical protein